MTRSSDEHIDYLEAKITEQGYPGFGAKEDGKLGMTRESVQQQADVFGKALAIYIDRTSVRDEVWAGFPGPEDALYQASSKLARAKRTCELISSRKRLKQPVPDALMLEALDSLHDLINFAAFSARYLTGEKPEVDPVDF